MATLRQVFRTLFEGSPARDNPFEIPPRLPTDVFAYVGHLVERSGAYHHIAPEVFAPSKPKARRILVDESMRQRAVALGHLPPSVPSLGYLSLQLRCTTYGNP